MTNHSTSYPPTNPPTSQPTNPPQAYFHELGHNFWLGHAGRYHDPVCDLCDWSSAMGNCCRVRCFHAPHNWQLGWARPVGGSAGVISRESLGPGETRTVLLPAQLRGPGSMVSAPVCGCG